MAARPHDTPATDDAILRRAIEIARRGRGRVEPNPMVGAVVVADGRVIAESPHRDYGGPHAEAAALRKAGALARGATLYVTLEPCSTYGKTPPCTRAVLDSGVARVVVGTRDPDPRHRGRGIRLLEDAGIRVETGVLDRPSRALLTPFCAYLDGSLPFVTAKWAMTLDGQVATRSRASKWITSEASRREAHKERARSDAIVIGSGTAIADDPTLTTRLARGRSPARVVLDSKLRMPLDARLVRTVDDAPLWIVTTSAAPERRIAEFERAGCRVLRVSARRGRVSLRMALKRLRAEGLHRVLLEGGPTLIGDAMQQGLVHRVFAFVAGRIFGGDDGLGPVAGTGVSRPDRALELVDVRRRALGDRDFSIEGIVTPESGFA